LGKEKLEAKPFVFSACSAVEAYSRINPEALPDAQTTKRQRRGELER
jgi:hypothetical protein